VGKVWEGEKRSLGAIFAAQRRAQPQPQTAAAAMEAGDDGLMQQLKAAVRSRGPGYEGLLSLGRITRTNSGDVIIRYTHEHEATATLLGRNGKREAVQEVLGELLQRPVALKIEVDAPAADATAPEAPQDHRPAFVRPKLSDIQDAPAPAPAAVPAVSSEQKKQILDNDPLIRAACELFAGDIVKVD
jgi:hypothetical protein